MIENNESHDIQTIENLNFAMIEVSMGVEILQESFKDNSNQLFASENASRFRRIDDLQNLNQLYSSVTERLNEIDDLFEGKISKWNINWPQLSSVLWFKAWNFEKMVSQI